MDPQTWGSENIRFRGEILRNINTEGSTIYMRENRLKLNAYSGFWDEFDYSEDAIRFLTLGSSYTNGCCFKQVEEDLLFHSVAEQLLEKRLKRNVQFADSSWNGWAKLSRYIVKYGNKILEKGVQHDYVLLELCLDNFIGPEHERQSVDRGLPIKVNEFDDKEPNNFYQSLVKSPYFYTPRLLLFSFNIFKNYGIYLSPNYIFKKITGKGIVKFSTPNKNAPIISRHINGLPWIEYRLAIYDMNHPENDPNELTSMSQDEVDEAFKVASIRLQDRLPEGLSNIKRLKEVVNEAGAELFVMIFPEIPRPELITILNQLKNMKIKFVYLNSLRQYRNKELWKLQHPTSAKAQQLWAQEFVAEFMKQL